MATNRILLALGLVFSLVLSATAEPLDPEQVAEGAKWVMHVDFDALSETQLAEHIRTTKLDQPLVKKWLDMVADKYGIDMRNGLHGLTVYGSNFEKDQGVALLAAKYDHDKAVAVLKKQPGYAASEHGDYTYHKFEKRRGHWHHKTDSAKAKEPEKKTDKDQPAQTVIAVLLDDMVLMASDEKTAAQALDVIEGDARHLKRRSPLLGERPDGTVLYAAVQDISELGEHCHKLGKLAIVQQGRSANVAIGEDGDDIAFYHLRFVALSDDVADKVGQMAAGFKAMLDLHTLAHEELAPVVEGLETEVDGETVYVDWEADATEVMKLHKLHEEKHRAWREKHGKTKLDAEKKPDAEKSKK